MLIGAGILALVGFHAAVAARLVASEPRPPEVVSFDTDIRPILSNNCFVCHGPDRGTRRAGLRLDRAEGLAEVVSAGDAVGSVLFERITATDPDERMPPPESTKSLSAEQIELIRAWIDQGATWQEHWAFVAPVARDLPAVRDASWAREPLDQLVLARLERAGVAPSPEATRATWLRRVTFDLTGLPPTLSEIDAFRRDVAPGAHERVVDRLLASPAFGERMATPWLDAARYADSFGYQSDQLSPTWPWRDWVVDAFNANMPYDQFITAQLAGDLLPEATRDQRLATAFNRLHRMTNEGGSIAEEFRNEAVSDRVHTMGAAFMGLTLECARCHDHKFDPISQREYYALTAFFNRIDEFGLYERTDIVPTPTLLLPTPEQESELEHRHAAVASAERAVASARIGIESRFAAWQVIESAGAADIPDTVGRHHFDAPDFSGAGVHLVDAERPGGGSALAFDGDGYAHVPGVADLDRWTPFTIAAWVRDDEPVPDARVVLHRSSGTDVGHYGFALVLRDGYLRASAVRHWPGNAIAIETEAPVVIGNRWTHVTWRYDGSSRAAGLALFIDGRRVPCRTVRDHVWKSVGGGHNYGPGGHDLVLGQRFRDRGFRGGLIDDVVIIRRAVSDAEVRVLLDPPGEMTLERYASAHDETMRTAVAELTSARKALVETENTIAEIMVMDDRADPAPAHLLERGRYDAPRTAATQVDAGVPAALSPWPEGAPANRLGLARWLTDPAHPLTSRVAVNRAWAHFFGRGLVVTGEDFGAQGEPATHPELLDWLAVDFVRSHWDFKRLCRSIALSATYRQASARDRPALRDDPDNRWLARGPARRLSAEELRDAALAASGLLERTRGGPPVSPYQPTGLWTESNAMSPGYRQSTGTALHRRSLYSVWKRTAPLPNMMAFDAPSREVCTVRRASTSTPLQALVLLNDPQFVEAARAMGARMLEADDTDDRRIHHAFLAFTGRDPTALESSLLVDLYDDQRQHFTAEPELAARLLSVGAWPQPEGDPVEFAAATVVAQAILNLDAATWKR